LLSALKKRRSAIFWGSATDSPLNYKKTESTQPPSSPPLKRDGSVNYSAPRVTGQSWNFAESLASLFSKKRRSEKAGVFLGDFSEQDARQLDLLSPEALNEKKQKAMEAVDRITGRFDKPAIRFAAEGIGQPLKSQPSCVSPKFITSWHDLLKVR